MVVSRSDFWVDDGMYVFIELNGFKEEFETKIVIAAVDCSTTGFEDLFGNGCLEKRGSATGEWCCISFSD